MRVESVPKMSLLITGDWQTVISSKTYRDQLLDQRPDEDMADWAQYRIECASTVELVLAYQEFYNRLKLHCHFSFHMQTEEVKMDLLTGYAEKNNPLCWVDVKRATSKIEQAAVDAIWILSKAIE
jgi:hypothetical protein